MAYGTIKVDNITFTNGGVDQTIAVSGVVQSISGDITATGTIQGATIIGTSTVSGATVTGDAGQFTTATITSGVFASGTAAAPSVSVGTTDNGIYSPGTDQVAISTNGTGQLFVTSSGNVGLGTNSPGGKAHINHTAGLPVTSGSTQTHGALRFGASGTNGVLDIGNAGASGSWLQATNQTSLIPGNSFPLLLNPNGGNVGVGSSSPGQQMVVRGSQPFLEIRDSRTGNWSAEDVFSGILFGTDDTTTAVDPHAFIKAVHTRTGTGHSSADAGLTFGTSGSTTTPAVERMRIDDQGRVGVGSTAPVTNLTVYGTASAAQFQNSNTGSGSSDGFYVGNYGGLSAQVWQYENDVIQFGTNNSERARIDSSGRLLVGTSSATANGGVLQISNGITFPATQSACSDPNTLDDYEEGTWIPTVVGTTSAGTASYSSQIGVYTKIGNMVTVYCQVGWSGGTGTGNLRIEGLPFTSSQNTVIALGASSNLSYTSGQTTYGYTSSSNVINIGVSTPSAGAAALAYDSAASIFITLTYFIS